MLISKSLLIASALVASLAAPGFAASLKPASAPVPPHAASTACMAPAAFLTALADAGDWIVKREVYAGNQKKLNGVEFREGTMIDVALFKDGCLAMVIEVGRSAPDLQV